LLVVDDDPYVLDLVRQLLNDSHYEIESVLDGVSALESIERQRPDAILLDLMLPRLDGFGVIEQLHGDPAHRTIPIVVITAKTLTAEEAARLHASVSAVIQKQGLDAGSLIRDIENAMQTQPLS
jgi:CheY-like chemotaxis protein